MLNQYVRRFVVMGALSAAALLFCCRGGEPQAPATDETTNTALATEERLREIERQVAELRRRLLVAEKRAAEAERRSAMAEQRTRKALAEALNSEVRPKEAEAQIAAKEREPREVVEDTTTVRLTSRNDPFNPDFKHPQDTPLHVAARKKDIAALKAALEAGADVNAISNGWTPIRNAVLNGDLAAAELLIAHGADLELGDGDGDTALGDAALFNKSEMVQLLIDRGGAKLETANDAGHTPLMRAARQSHREVSELLIKTGADVDAVDAKGNTPLIWAAAGGHKELVELLIEWGANAYVKNSQGQTAMELAKRHGHQNVADVLQNSLKEEAP